MTPFARGYPTFTDWDENRVENRYTRTIRQKYHCFPDRTLKELKNTSYKNITLTRIPWRDLTPEEKRGRINAVNVLNRMRRGDSLYIAMLRHGLCINDIEDVATHLAPYYLCWDDSKRTWQYQPTDTIEIEMNIIERNNGFTTIVTKHSRDRSLIGSYFASVRIALDSGNTERLANFTGKKVVDTYGVAHYFETDLEVLYQIREMQEDPERFEIYSTRGE